MFLIIPLVFLLITCQNKLTTLNNFRQLAIHHCNNYPLDLILRTASGRLAEIYGPNYISYDSYIRQIIGSDLEDKPDFQSQEQLEADWVVQQYIKGIKQCGLNWETKQVYLIWRFLRYILTHDHIYQWMRAKMRISFGYQILRPNSWIDGQQKEARLRLEKLFSNEYLDSLEDLMHRDFLFSLVTTLRKSTTIITNGNFSKSKKNLFIHILNTRNYEPNIFSPVELIIQNKKIFAITLPGLPLLLSVSSKSIAWGFTGILIDRTNIQYIQTAGMKYWDEQQQRWIKIKNVTQTIKVKGQNDRTFNYYWSQFGTIVQKSTQSTKIKQYIVRWRENQKKMRRVFSGLVSLIKQPLSSPILYFPWNSLVIANQNAIRQIISPPQFSHYFIYPELIGEPKTIDQSKLWGQNPKRGFWAITNSHLSSPKPQGYLDRQMFSPEQQALTQIIRKWKQKNIDILQGTKQIMTSGYNVNIKKITDLLVFIYRKAKFTYFQQDHIRKEADQLISLLDKWNYNPQHQLYGSIYKLWIYHLKGLMFNHLTRSQKAKYLARYRLITDTYLANQISLWKQVTSYGECDIHEYKKIQINVNHTNHNCTCYYIIFAALNKTREFLKSQKGLLQTNSNNFNRRVNINLLEDANKVIENLDIKDMAFENSYGQNLILATQIGHKTYYSVNGDPLSQYVQSSKELQDTDL